MRKPLTVIKVGGATTRDAEVFRQVIEGLTVLAVLKPIVVVPGGGALADGVRRIQGELGCSDSAAHWMALLAMDQVAEVLSDALPGSRLVDDTGGVHDALAEGEIPVLAPARWMKAADMLRHSWDVTSDSIAAFIAGALDATELILVKRTEGDWRSVGDVALADVKPAALPIRVVTPERLAALD